jgi:hypothetical protein
LLSLIPRPKRQILERIVLQLSAVDGMVAVALGGSYASGAQHAHSDLDIGLYYHPSNPFSIAEIRSIAQAVSMDEKPVVTSFYEWGAWVNGGAWIDTPQGKVDFLYRNLDQVQRTIAEAQQGILQHDYDQQPTYGFYNVIYLAETQICQPLFDPQQALAKLKRQVETYPPQLKQKIIAESLWSAEFTLLHARGFAAQGDVYNTVGCLTRAAANLTQTLFALNERFFLRDKQVMEVIASFSLLPKGYTEQIKKILSSPGETPDALTHAKINISWQTWYPACSSTPWQIEGVIRALKNAGL